MTHETVVVKADPELLLRNAIIEQAVRDFIRGAATREYELRRFFNSKWCQFLLDMDRLGDGMTGADILKALEARKRKRRGHEWEV